MTSPTPRRKRGLTPFRALMLAFVLLLLFGLFFLILGLATGPAPATLLPSPFTTPQYL